MRSYELRISTDVRLFNARSDLREGEPVVTAIHGIKPAGDGRFGTLLEYGGTPEAVRDHLEPLANVDTSEVQITEHGDNTLVYHVQELPGIVGTLIDALFSSPVLVEYPITVRPDDDLLATLVGDEASLRGMATLDIPHVDVTVERSGPYRPGVVDAFSDLTPRQREVLIVAAELGYYDQPRRATYEDVAEELDLAYSTVGEHLRKAEARLLSETIPTGERDG